MSYPLVKKNLPAIVATAILGTTLVLGVATPAQASVPRSYRNALATAHDYVDGQDFSKEGLYDQLHSRYGEGFSAKAARYGVNHVHANWSKEALGAATSYVHSGDFSKAGLHDQLTSDSEQYTDGQADYALKHVKVNYNKEALDAARSYDKLFHMSDSEMFDQLTSDADQFTDGQANYAIDHL
jgi:uncharacterized lipoprotein YddW (UPF0748 family)